MSQPSRDGDPDDVFDAADHLVNWDRVDELPALMDEVGDDPEKAKAFYRRLAGRDD